MLRISSRPKRYIENSSMWKYAAYSIFLYEGSPLLLNFQTLDIIQWIDQTVDQKFVDKDASGMSVNKRQALKL